MRRFNSKSVYILSTLLLSDKPLSISEIAKQTGYFRQTLDPYITCFVSAGYISNVGISSRNKWIIPESRKNHVLNIVINNDVAPSRRILDALEQKYGRIKWVHLVDADSFGGFPNLALMKLSTYYNLLGCKVTFSYGLDFGITDRKAPDKIYVSVIYKWDAHKFDDLYTVFPTSEIDIGGSGVDLEKKLPEEIENMKPDYSLYKNLRASVGFSSRGCCRKGCDFCIVKKKEGQFRQTQHPSEWYNPDYKYIRFLDNNILCDKNWFFKVTNWCLEKKLKIWFTQGLDIRLIDLEIARQLFKFRNHHSTLTFAWDDKRYEDDVRKGIQILTQAGFTDSMLHSRIQFYVYVHSDAMYEDAVYRCRELKKLNCSAYIMWNKENKETPRIIKLKNWANGKNGFWVSDIDDYDYEPERRARRKQICS